MTPLLIKVGPSTRRSNIFMGFCSAQYKLEGYTTEPPREKSLIQTLHSANAYQSHVRPAWWARFGEGQKRFMCPLIIQKITPVAIYLKPLVTKDFIKEREREMKDGAEQVEQEADREQKDDMRDVITKQGSWTQRDCHLVRYYSWLSFCFSYCPRYYFIFSHSAFKNKKKKVNVLFSQRQYLRHISLECLTPWNSVTKFMEYKIAQAQTHNGVYRTLQSWPLTCSLWKLGCGPRKERT